MADEKTDKSTELSTRNEIDRMNYQISTDQLKGIGTTGNAFDDALQLAKEIYGEEAVQLASEAIGDGFALTDNKDQFIGVPCIFLKWTFSPGDFVDTKTGEKKDFATVRIVTKDGGKFVINDGSTGICDQLRQYTNDNFGRQGGLVALHGLRRSDYENEFGNATTHYIDTSA